MSETRRVTILAVRFGSGHWQAALALKKALVEAHPALEVDIVNYMRFAGFMFDINIRLIYHDLMIRLPWIYRRFFNYMDQMRPDSLLQKFIKICGAPAFLRYFRRKTPRLIISTYPVPSAVVSRLKERGLITCPLVTVITDYVLHQQWIQSGTDLYLAATPEVARELMRRGVSGERVAVTGIPIDLRFENGRRHRLAELLPQQVEDLPETLPELPLVLVISGVTGFGGDLVRVCRLLARLPAPHVAVVLGVRLPRLRLALRQAASKGRNRVFVVGYSREVPRFMSAASCLITKAGGITVSEALAARVPLLIYRPLPGQEELNRDFLVREGAALTAGNLSDLGQLVIELLQDEALRRRLREAGERLGHPDAARAAVKLIFSRFEAVAREAGQEDRRQQGQGEGQESRLPVPPS
jgi:processive 1,2-diacylglycerol beta-glucosyltransferase